MTLRRLLCVPLVVAVVAAAGCGGGDGSTSTPPFGLPISQPETAEEILTVLAQMPPQLDGLNRTPGEHPFIIQYGELNSIVAIPLTEGDVPLSEDLGRFQLESGAQVEEIQVDRSDLVWLVGSFPDAGGAGTVYLAVWGDPNGVWAFNVSAENPEARAAIARAFAAAAG